jgi:hypothetical protein
MWSSSHIRPTCLVALVLLASCGSPTGMAATSPGLETGRVTPTPMPATYWDLLPLTSQPEGGGRPAGAESWASPSSARPCMTNWIADGSCFLSKSMRTLRTPSSGSGQSASACTRTGRAMSPNVLPRSGLRPSSRYSPQWSRSLSTECRHSVSSTACLRRPIWSTSSSLSQPSPTRSTSSSTGACLRWCPLVLWSSTRPVEGSLDGF